MHVWSAHTLMKRAGQQSSVLNVDPRAPESDRYIKISGGVDFVRQLVRHVGNDWMLNVHTNGHNPKSWAIAAVCGVAAQLVLEPRSCSIPVWRRPIFAARRRE